jgi:hypothetical protein
LLVLAVVFAVGSVARVPIVGRARSRSDDGLLAAAVAVSLVVIGVSAVTFDTFNVLGSARLFWILCGCGLAATERLAGPERVPRPANLLSLPRLALIAAAAVVGAVVFIAAPRHASEQVVFATLDLRTEVSALPAGMGATLATTACDAAVNIAGVHEPWRVTSCIAQGPPGWGVLRVQADHRAQVTNAITRIASSIHAVPGEQGLRVSVSAAGPVGGRPTAATAAPVVLPLAAVVACLFVPRRRRSGPT